MSKSLFYVDQESRIVLTLDLYIALDTTLQPSMSVRLSESKTPKQHKINQSFHLTNIHHIIHTIKHNISLTITHNITTQNNIKTQHHHTTSPHNITTQHHTQHDITTSPHHHTTIILIMVHFIFNLSDF